jgi:PhoH-like ATPase
MIEIGQKLGYLPGKVEEKQVDNPYLNQENNGLNWVVKKFKGSKIYSHLVLKGEKSRGPITDLVINTGL